MLLNKNNNTNNYLFILLTLFMVSFFNPLNIFDSQDTKLLCIIGTGVIFIWTLLKRLEHLSYPRFYYFLVIMGFVTGLASTILFQKQNYLTSIIAISIFFTSWLSFYVLLRLQPDKKFVVKSLFIFSFISIGIYAINFITFPNVFLGGVKDEIADVSRGFLRIKVPMLEVIVLCMFYVINKISINKKVRISYILLVILFYFMVLVSLTRQLIILSTVFGCLLYLANQPLVKKISAVMVLFTIFVFVVPELEIYQNLANVTERQLSKNDGIDGDIRVKAWQFYVYEYQTNYITPIIGNGVPALHKSEWGKTVDRKTDLAKGGNACYIGDVGWAGYFWYFGLIGTSGLLGLILSGIRKNKSQEEQYLSYWLMFVMITSVASAPILYSNQVYTICIVLYLTYGKNSSNNFRVQQF